MKKLLFILLSLLFFISIVFAIPNITHPSNNYQNISNYNITWENTTIANCYQLEESISNSNNFNLIYSDSTPNFSRSGIEDGVYYYRVRSTSNSCLDNLKTWSDWSATKYIIVDTTPPVVSSKFPSGVNEPSSGVVNVSFDEAMNVSSTTFSSATLTLTNPVWSGGDTILTYDYSGSQGTDYVVNISGQDLAGNAVADSVSFSTGVDADNVTITAPLDGDSYIQNDMLAITATVTGGGQPCIGAEVTSSGACSTSLTDDDNDGTYTGSCELTDNGSLDLIVTAVKGTTANDSVSLNVAKNIGLTLSVLSPTSSEATRGDLIPIKVKVTADDVPVDNAVVSSSDVTFTHTQNGEYTGTLQTSYSTPKTYSLEISAEATVQNQHKTTSKTITFTIQPLPLTITPVFLENNQPTQVIHSGKVVSLKIKALYPSGSVAEGTPQGTVTVTSNGKQAEAINLTFTKQGDYYVTDSLFTASDYDSSYAFAVTFTDPYGNQGVMEQSILGPAKGLKFIPDADELVFSPGQEAVIKGKVRDEFNEKFLTDAVIIFNNKSFDYASNGYVLSFNVSLNESVGTKTLNLLIKTSSMDYPFPLTITIIKSLKVVLPDVVEKNKYVPVQVLYPDGSPVKQGNFSIIVNGEEFKLKKSDEGGWVTELNLGTSEGVSSLSLSGTDAYGNKLSAEKQVQYKIGNVERIKQNAPLITGVLIALIVTAFIISYFYAYSKIKSKVVLSKKQVIEKYKHLLFEKEKTNYLKDLITYSVMTKQIRKEEQPKYQQDLVQTKNELDLLIGEFESSYSYLKKDKLVYSKEAIEKLEKIKPIIKKNITEELKESKALNFIKQKLNYGLDEESVKKQVVEKFKEAGKRAIEKAEIINLFNKNKLKQETEEDNNKQESNEKSSNEEKNNEKYNEKVNENESNGRSSLIKETEKQKQINSTSSDNPVVNTSKLLKALPEFRVKEELRAGGLTEKQINYLINEAKKLL